MSSLFWLEMVQKLLYKEGVRRKEDKAATICYVARFNFTPDQPINHKKLNKDMRQTNNKNEPQREKTKR